MWQAPAGELTDVTLAGWQRESVNLANAPQQHAALALAQVADADLAERWTRCERDLAAIPDAARQAPEALEVTERRVREDRRAAENLWQTATDACQALKASQARREELLALERSHAGQAEVYKDLAQLLGPDRLQHHLLKQAEAAIVEAANTVLDRISSGKIRLALIQATGDGGTGTRDPRALELVAYNAAVGDRSIPVDLLSGGQRFRVAMSLALGIGAYTSHGAEPTETVIIDEGFGGLDKRGLAEVIDEIYDLQTVLSRIILVSHQDEVASAFPNGYAIQLEGGTSRIAFRSGN